MSPPGLDTLPSNVRSRPRVAPRLFYYPLPPTFHPQSPILHFFLASPTFSLRTCPPFILLVLALQLLEERELRKACIRSVLGGRTVPAAHGDRRSCTADSSCIVNHCVFQLDTRCAGAKPNQRPHTGSSSGHRRTGSSSAGAGLCVNFNLPRWRGTINTVRGVIPEWYVALPRGGLCTDDPPNICARDVSPTPETTVSESTTAQMKHISTVQTRHATCLDRWTSARVLLRSSRTTARTVVRHDTPVHPMRASLSFASLLYNFPTFMLLFGHSLSHPCLFVCSLSLFFFWLAARIRMSRFFCDNFLGPCLSIGLFYFKLSRLPTDNLGWSRSPCHRTRCADLTSWLRPRRERH